MEATKNIIENRKKEREEKNARKAIIFRLWLSDKLKCQLINMQGQNAT
jgi:hypothetical protein